MNWGEGLDSAKRVPTIPQRLNTVRCHNFASRWRERRAILVQQRDIRVRRQMLLEQADDRPCARFNQRALDTINKRIDECNDAIDAILGEET